MHTCFGKQSSPDGIHHNAMQFMHHSEVQGFRIVQPHPHCIAKLCITFKNIASQYKVLHHSALNCVAAAPCALHCITVHSIASRYNTLHCTVLHSPTPRPGAVLVGATSLSQVGSAASALSFAMLQGIELHVGSAASAPCFAIHCNALFLEVGSVAHSIAL